MYIHFDGVLNGSGVCPFPTSLKEAFLHLLNMLSYLYGSFLLYLWQINSYGFGSDVVETKVHESAKRTRFAPLIFGNEVFVAFNVVGNTA